VPDWEYSLQKATLSPGSLLFLYTDGLTEATRTGGELFSEERVLENLSGLEEMTSSADIIAHMTSAVNEFVGDSEQSDDLTMMAIRLMPKS
jgi:sigma-B regulation protein RsbU (phosphoserine phosphatase)